MKFAHRFAIGGAAVIGLFAVWQVAAASGWIDAMFLPPPTEIARTTLDLLRNGYQQIPLWQHVLVSVVRALAAFVVSVVVGVPLGLAMGLSPLTSALLDPFIQFLRPLPKIALIPLTVVWFGIGETSKFS